MANKEFIKSGLIWTVFNNGEILDLIIVHVYICVTFSDHCADRIWLGGQERSCFTRGN